MLKTAQLPSRVIQVVIPDKDYRKLSKISAKKGLSIPGLLRVAVTMIYLDPLDWRKEVK